MSRSQKLVSNISLNFLTNFFLLLISFFATPLIFHKFGPIKYGLFVLLGIIPSYFSVLDFGLLPSLIRFIADSRAQNKNLNSLINACFTYFLFLSLLLSLIIYFSANFFIINVLKIPSPLIPEAIIGLKLLSLSFFLTAIGTFFVSIPQALHRFDISNLKNVFLGIFIPFGTVITLYLGFGIKEVIYVYILVNFLTIIFMFLICKKLLPTLRLGFNFSFSHIKLLLNFGWYKFLSSLSSRLVAQLNQLLVGIYLPVQFAGYYSITSGVAQKPNELLPNISTPVFPLTAELHSLVQKEKLTKLYVKTITFTNILLIPLSIFIFFCSYPILALWVSPELANHSSFLLKILSMGFLISSFAAIPATVVDGMNKPKITAFFSLISAGIYLILAFILIPRFGFLGAGYTILLNSLLSVPIFIYYVNHKIIKINNLSIYWQMYFKPFIIACLSFLPFLLFINKLTILWLIGFFGIVYFLLFIIFCYLTDIVGKEEINIFKKFILSMVHNK